MQQAAGIINTHHPDIVFGYVYKNGYISDELVCRFFRCKLFDNNLFYAIPRWNEDTLWNIELLKKCQTGVIFKSRW